MIWQRNLEQDRTLLTKPYDYYFGEIKQYSQHMAVDETGLQKVIDALKGRGDIKAQWKERDFLDLVYLPR